MKSDGRQTNELFYALAIIAIASLLSVSFYFLKKAEYKDWVSTEGILIDMKKTYSSGGRHHFSSRGYKLYYTYEIDGKNYKGEDSFSGDLPTDLLIGKKVEIWYNPANCSRSMYGKPGPGLWPYAPFILSFPLLVGALCGVFNRKDHLLR